MTRTLALAAAAAATALLAAPRLPGQAKLFPEPTLSRLQQGITHIYSLEHDRAIEAAFGLPSGEVQEWRRSSARILLWLTDETGAPLGYASFNPGFPGAFPFRLARVALARNLIEAIRPHAPAGVPHVQFVVEDMPELTKLLCDAGGKVRMVFCHYRGELPPAR